MVTPLKKTCPGCESAYETVDKRQTYCSHKCAAGHMHSRRFVTTDGYGKDVALINSDNPRYTLDEAGQWWYRPIGTKQHGRSRAHVQTCPECRSEFLICIFHKGKQAYCTRACAAKVHGAALRGKNRGPDSNSWQGGRKVVRGYVWIYAPDHHTSIASKSPNKKYVLEHRIVMERHLGRNLLSHENIHHINGIRDDNRIENLELWQRPQPPGQRHNEKQHCRTCTCFTCE